MMKLGAVINLIITMILVVSYIVFCIFSKKNDEHTILDIPNFDFPESPSINKLPKWVKYGYAVSKRLEVWILNICIGIALCVDYFTNTEKNSIVTLIIAISIIVTEYLLAYIIMAFAKFEVYTFYEFMFLLVLAVEFIVIGQISNTETWFIVCKIVLALFCAFTTGRVIYIMHSILNKKINLILSKTATVFTILFIIYILLIALVQLTLTIETSDPYNDSMDNLITVAYYVMMSLSTIGFGDIHPMTPLSRLVAIWISINSISCLVVFAGSFTPQNQADK